MGRICSACHEELPKKNFSGKQWAADEAQRRCKNCTSNNNRSKPVPRPASSDVHPGAQSKTEATREPFDYISRHRSRETLLEDDGVSCWICLGESTEQDPLLRDCVCKGSAGFAHFNCLVEYSTKKINYQLEEGKRGASVNFGAFSNIWTICPTCLEGYKNYLGLALAAAFIDFVEWHMDVGHDERTKQWMRVESNLCLALGFKGAMHLDGRYVEEGMQLSNNILQKLLPKIENSPLVPKQRVRELEADLHRIALRSFARHRGDNRAEIRYLEHARDLFTRLDSGNIELHYDQDYKGRIASISDDIKLVECELEEIEYELQNAEDSDAGLNVSKLNESSLKSRAARCLRRWIEARNEKGDLSMTAIDRGIKYANSLLGVQKVKSERALKYFMAQSKEIFGEDHWLHKKAERMYNETTIRIILIASHNGVHRYRVRGYNAQEDLYLLDAPNESDERNFDNDGNYKFEEMRGKTVLVPRQRCLYFDVVTVIVGGLPPGPLEHLNGKIGETKFANISEDPDLAEQSFVASYVIRFEDDAIDDCEIPPKNLLVIVNLPPQSAETNLESMEKVFRQMSEEK